MGAGMRPGPATLPAWVVCPQCHKSMDAHADGVVCRQCKRLYAAENSFLNLLKDPADRFHDEVNEDRDRKEEASNTHSIQSYTVPLLRKLFGDRESMPRLLSTGCGVGVDVDLLTDAGFDAYGIDCGERTHIWGRRKYPERMYIANAKALPFADGTFDFVSTSCLLPHVGVVGDTTEVTPDHKQQRERAAREVARVVRPGGYIFMMNPNRRCPLDFHHLQPNPNRLVRLHSPAEPFLLSLGDVRRLYVERAGCRSAKALPPAGYWGFLQKKTDPKRRLLVAPVRWYTQLISSRWFTPLLSSPLNPWLLVLVQK